MTAPDAPLDTSKPPDLTPLLAPRTIAVIGASQRAGSMGHQVLANLIDFGFAGTVYPVNPRAPSVRSVRAYPTIGDVPEAVDLAVIVVPRDHAVAAVEACGEVGVKGVIVITAGFREVGGDGVSLEQRLMDVVLGHGMRMIGPNCMGVINADPAVSMNATFVPIMPPFGHAAFVSQSGALGLSVLDYAREYGIGISQFVSIGNSPDVSSTDLLEQWEDDPAVRVILMYVENFGEPRRFLDSASRITKHKPIIVVKSGRSRAGARAASSHTGALAASDTAVDAMLSQAGVLRANSIEDLFDMAMGFGVKARPRSRRTAVLTNAGGPGILAADALETQGLELVDLSPETVEALRPLFPPEASIRNPLDMIASATPAGYKAALTAFLADPHIDAVVPIFVPPFGVRQEDVAEAIVSASQVRPDKPMLAVLMGLKGLPQGRSELHTAGIPAYIFPESAARALNALNRQREWEERTAAGESLRQVQRAAAEAIVNAVRAAGREQLTQEESIALLEAYGIPAAGVRLVAAREELRDAAQAIGYPLAMKLSSPDITHKTDVGGVQVGIGDDEALLRAYDEMLARVRAAAPAARIDGVVLQHMVQGGRETIAGVTRDPRFGPLLMFGLGGVFVEALQDVIFRVAPVDDAQALDMVRGIRGARVLQGIRGAPPCDEGALVDALCRLGQLAADFPAIAELDVNPLMALTHGVVAVDARVRLESS
ncbi:MAG TPA: acetate--CoA ligase family protein [Gemmatimonadaceae bacterium]|nr:acetate--CoA ligase family protein [Gemmatimonadaceae bacterium]